MLTAIKTHMRIIKTFNLYLDFFLLGIVFSVTGPCLLDLQHMVHTDTRHIAFIYSARSIGHLTGAAIGGIVLDLLKSKHAALTFCNFLLSVSVFAVPWCRSVEPLIGLMAATGVLYGMLQAGGNVTCLDLWGKRSGPFFQGMHFVFGLGGFVAPLIAAPFLESRSNPTSLVDSSTSENSTLLISASTDLMSNYFNTTASGVSSVTYPFSIVGAYALLVTILFLSATILSPTEDGENESGAPDNSKISCMFMSVTFIFTFLLFFVGLGAEIGFNQTLTAYAVKGPLQTTSSVGSYMTSAFWGTFTATRFVYVFLAIKISNETLVMSNIAIMFVSNVFLLTLKSSAWALWLASVLYGIGVGPIFSTLVSWLNSHVHVTNKISAFITVSCGAGDMVYPFIMTYFMDTRPENVPFIISVSTVIMSFLFTIQHFIFKKINKNRTEDRNPECYLIEGTVKEQVCINGSSENKAY